MFRILARIVVVAVACAALLAVVGAARASGSGTNLVALLARDSGPATPASAPGDVYPADTPGAVSSGAGDTPSVDPNVDPNGDQAQEQETPGVIASVDPANSMFTLTTSSGAATITVTSATQFDDGLSALTSLQPGMYVTVEGSGPLAANQTISAIEISGPDGAGATESADEGDPGNDSH